MDYDRIRAAHRRFVADIIGIIYNNFVHQTPKVRVIGLLNRELAALERDLGGLEPVEKAFLRVSMRNFYYLVSKNSVVELRKVGKQVNYQEFIEKRSEIVFEAVKKNIINNDLMVKTMNEGVRMCEFAIKKEKIDDLLAPKDDYTPFVICDWHADCAKDHEGAQGKVYIKDGWEEYIEDDKVRARIIAYVRNKHVMKVSEITGKPVYLIYRPNCHHELHDVGIEEVLTSSAKRILTKHGWMYNSFKEKTYVDRWSRAYKERMQVYTELWKVAPNKNLAEEMNKTRKLYKKWMNLRKRG